LPRVVNSARAFLAVQSGTDIVSAGFEALRITIRRAQLPVVAQLALLPHPAADRIPAALNGTLRDASVGNFAY